MRAVRRYSVAAADGVFLLQSGKLTGDGLGAVAGKGGAGKTTASGTIARSFARAGHRVLALDADANPMLGASLGVGPEETDRLLAVRQAIDADELEHQRWPTS